MSLPADALYADRCFLLDGGGARPWSGSRSVLGVLTEDDLSLTFDAAAREVVAHRGGTGEVIGDDIFTVLDEQLARDREDRDVSWVGYLGYGCRPDLPVRPAEGVPDAVWLRARRPLVLPGVGPVRRASSGTRPQTPHTEDVPGWYAEAFGAVQRELRAGNSYEVNLTYRESARATADPVTVHQRLRTLNPAPYSGFLRHRTPAGEVALLSSSPERFATVDRHRMLEAKPIKGTTARGSTPAEDTAHRERLATEPKFRAENLMIVDLLRNDLATVCEVGSVTVPELMAVESYESVHQLVSTVRGRLRPEVGTVAALRSLFPAGSMTGAPKRRTMQIIDTAEATPRGVYAGAFGWLAGDGRADLAVVIRSLVAVPAADGWDYTWGTGGGITVRSDVAEEWAETRWKAARLRAALGLG